MKLQKFFLLFCCFRLVFCGSIDEGPAIRKRSTQNLEAICGKSSVTSEFESLTSNDITVTSEQWPWMGSMYYDEKYNCGGNIVSEKLIVTAASCILDRFSSSPKEASKLSFIVGGRNLTDGTQRNFQSHSVSEIILHPKWNSDESKAYQANIALVILKTPITFSKNVMPICLPSTGSLQYNVKGAVVKWKIVENEPTILELTKLLALDKLSCIESENELAYIMGASSFCTERSESGPCRGASGGGFAQLVNDRWTLMGLVSFSNVHTCTEKRHVGFEDVTKFIDWIKKYMPDTRQDEATQSSEQICGKTSGNRRTQSLISHGNIVTSEQWPWMGALNYGTLFVCGGSIVSDKLIVTAAHCIIDKDDAEQKETSQLIFIVGKSNLRDYREKNFQIKSISKIVVHPNWDPDLLSYEADIALAILKTPIIFKNNIIPICLPTPNSLEYNVIGAVAGWGATESSTGSNVLKLAELAVVEKKVCIKGDNVFSQTMSSTSFCTELSESGPCKGDSGGGYAQLINDHWTLMGIVSFSGLKPCRAKHHIGYTDVTKFVDWIKEHMAENVDA